MNFIHAWFVVKEKELADRKSRKFARKLSALGQNYCDSLAEIPGDNDGEEIERPLFKASMEAVGNTDA